MRGAMAQRGQVWGPGGGAGVGERGEQDSQLISVKSRECQCLWYVCLALMLISVARKQSR